LDKAIPCALITNELVSNAIKHAFSGRKDNTLLISFNQEAAGIVLKVKDNGLGLPENMEWEKSSSVGFTIIHALCKQLGGKGKFSPTPGGGTQFSLTFTSDTPAVSVMA
jgi:two-component sensor histidine kinase